MFGHPVVVLSSLEAMSLCNFSSSDVFSHRPVWLKNVCSSITPGIIFKGSADYHNNRRFLLGSLKRRGMGKSGLEAQVLAEAEELVAHLKCFGEVDPQIIINNFTSNTIMTMCFGKRWNYNDKNYEDFSKAMDKVVDTFPLLFVEDLVPYFGYLPNIKQAKRENADANTILRTQFEEIITARVNGPDTESYDDLVSDYMGNKLGKMDEADMKNLVEICQDMFFAGSDTTSTTCNFAIIHLLNNPDWQEEVFAELNAVLQGRHPSMTDLQNLPKMEATINETLRLNPLVPLIFKANAETVKIREYTIPESTLILVNVYHISYDPLVFPEPASFKPCRWIGPEGKFSNELVEKVPTFGAGRRACLGRPLARMELFLLLATLLQNFTFSLPPGAPLPSGALAGDSIAMQPPPYTLKLVARNTDDQ